MKPSERPVSRTPAPLASIACRAARMRSVARPNSNNGLASSWVESSIEIPATPVPIARATFVATRPGSTAKPPSKSALTGTSTASTIAAKCASASSSGHRVVRPADAPGEPRAGGGEGLEAHLAEHPGAADVPRIGNHEAARLVQGSERLVLIRWARHSATILGRRPTRRGGGRGRARSWRRS